MDNERCKSKGFNKETMGLAASQARFLGITLRKANCEFQSTQLAEQRLRISNQLSDISQEYSNAMNATKLMWCNDIAEDNYAINYNLLMLPSALNDYDPYFVSTKSGALVLNDKYAAAAKAAGIGMAGSVPSESQRNAFIEALAGSKGGVNSITGATYDTDINLTTAETVNRILSGIGAGGTIESPIDWNRTAGMGAAPENKNVLDELLLSDLIEDANIGGANLDWLQMFTKDGVYTENEVEILEKQYKSVISEAKNVYLAEEDTHTTSTLTTLVTELESAAIVSTITTSLTADTIPYYNTELFDTSAGASNKTDAIVAQYKKLEYLAANANNTKAKEQYLSELKNLKLGKNANGEDFDDPTVYGVCWAYYNYTKHKPNGAIIAWHDGTEFGEIKDNDGNVTGYKNASEVSRDYIDRTTTTTLSTKYDSDGNLDTYKINMEDLFQTTERKIEDKDDKGVKIGTTTYTVAWTKYDQVCEDLKGSSVFFGGVEKLIAEMFSEEEIEAMKKEVINENKEITEDLYVSNLGYQFTVLKNGVINYDYKKLQNMTIADLLTDDIVIMNWWHGQNSSTNPKDAIKEMSYRVTKLMEYIAGIFGYGNIGTGLNVDSTTDEALTKALAMVEKKYLKSGNAILVGSDWSDSNPTACSVYKNANDYNRIGADVDGDTAAVNLSNLVSAFLTYYDNYLTESSMDYYVGKSNDDESGATSFVTDDPNYTYYTVDPEQMSDDEKIASFYDELYNNLCAHGWRADGQLDQPEYLETMIKNGRYQFMSLNNDGYYYQTRYADTGYIQEVTDEEAITRAEAEYTRKKAELTYKEDIIDMKSKNLDAEIAELNTEISSVQSMISKSIEKTFSMFQS